MIEALKAVLQEQEDSTRNVPENEDFLGDEISVFPNGDQAVICTSWADDLEARLGQDRVTKFGFWTEDNPGTAIERLAYGHDFAIVDGRYIVDGWIVHVEGVHEVGIFDIEDDGHLEDILKFYGNPASWEAKSNNAENAKTVASRVDERLQAAKGPALHT